MKRLQELIIIPIISFSVACGSIEDELVLEESRPEQVNLDYCKREAYKIEIQSSHINYNDPNNIRNFCSEYFNSWLESFERCINNNLIGLGYSRNVNCQSIPNYMYEQFLNSCVENQIRDPSSDIEISAWECYED